MECWTFLRISWSIQLSDIYKRKFISTIRSKGSSKLESISIQYLNKPHNRNKVWRARWMVDRNRKHQWITIRSIQLINTILASHPPNQLLIILLSNGFNSTPSSQINSKIPLNQTSVNSSHKRFKSHNTTWARYHSFCPNNYCTISLSLLSTNIIENKYK